VGIITLVMIALYVIMIVLMFAGVGLMQGLFRPGAGV
jgi:hypothetical protein